ncbi:chemosensory receptor C [Elysia marginata]|uniref:Chemosensory receptor C n=1 Tax=Elysia marginata TaxID=1093978 RepID=A0AAV4FBN5_9GAST|nr:chemosensory receptor C [Elysia marginata]
MRLVVQFVVVIVRTNSTYRSIKSTDNIRDIYHVNDILNRNIIPWAAYIIVVTCVVILASKLQAAARFRRSLAASTNGGSEKNKTGLSNSSDPSSLSEYSRHNEKSSSKMSTKDLQVVQSVTLICVIFILSQLPYQMISFVRLLIPDFNSFGESKYSFGLSGYAKNIFSYLNASVNICVYYHFNARYRETFRNIFSRKSV